MSAGTKTLRRRKKKTLAARLRVFWLLIVVVLAVAAYGGYVLVNLPQLRVHDITVNIAGHVVRQRDVIAAARIDPSANAWLLNTHAIAGRIEAIPYVADVRISRTPPANVDISVTERVPANCVRTRAGVVTLDEGPRVLQAGCAGARLPLLDLPATKLGPPGSSPADPALSTLLADGKTLAAAGIRVQRLARDRFGDLVATDVLGVELLLGADRDLGRKAALIEPVRAAAKGRRIHAIDLRAPGTPTVEFR
ncbi:MAG: hypothetical protein NVSMB5_01640 [Candidatus Velthaea sp.]